jgi:hypothetical protein
MMKRSITGLVLGGLVSLAAPAGAHEGAGGDLGVGVGIGAPTALSIELAPTPASGLELALGLRGLDDQHDAYAHLVYKHNLFHLAQGPSVIVPVYLGVGGFAREDGARSATDLGVRVPAGLNFDLTRSPVQFFAEAALDATLVSDADIARPLALDAMLGARVWF